MKNVVIAIAALTLITFVSIAWLLTATFKELPTALGHAKAQFEIAYTEDKSRG